MFLKSKVISLSNSLTAVLLLVSLKNKQVYSISYSFIRALFVSEHYLFWAFMLYIHY